MPDIYVMNDSISSGIFVGLVVSAVVVWAWQWVTGGKK